jgi:serine/threonine protein kinase
LDENNLNRMAMRIQFGVFEYNLIMSSNWSSRMLGKVRIDSLLARGGMAEVYLGTHVTLHREVAVKILRNNYDEDQDALERFQREARVVARLRHPNIVQVHDFDTISNYPYLVMEYIKGPSLSRYLAALHQKGERLELPVIARLLNAIASALQYAHQSGVIHRDVKPGNILLTSPTSQVEVGKPLPEDFEPVLTDFGLVRFLDASRQTTAGQIAGTPAYMSPEQARGEITDGRTDVYSLGIVIYEMLAGRLPFDGETTMSILLKHINEPPSPIPGLPPHIQRVLDRALAKDLENRFQTPGEFAKAFSAATERMLNPATVELELESIPPVPIASPTLKKAPRPKRVWLVAALAGITTIALASSALFSGLFAPRDPTQTATSTVPPATNTLVRPSPSILLGPTGVLRFQDGSEKVDRATLTVQAMPAPPEGTHYEVWLANSDERLNLGILSVDESGRGELVFTEEKGLNLVSLYDMVEVTVESDSENDPDAPGPVAYSFTLPASGLMHVRYLLASYPGAPDGNALIQGLHENGKITDELAQEMLTAYQRGDMPGVRRNAESILNLIVGSQSPEYKDWNGDGQIADAGDGYGLLLNGNNLGYIQAVFAEADYAANTPGATQKMTLHGEDVRQCTQNLALWAPQLRDLLLTILTSTAPSEVEQAVRDTATLTGLLFNGTDLDSNGEIGAVIGECGIQTTYKYTYYMADMPLLPTGLFSFSLTATGTPPTSTNTVTFSNVTLTSTPNPAGGGGGGGGAATSAPTRVPPGQENKTKKPSPVPPTQKPKNSNDK